MKHEEKDEVKGSPAIMVVTFFLIIITSFLTYEMFAYYGQLTP